MKDHLFPVPESLLHEFVARSQEQKEGTDERPFSDHAARACYLLDQHRGYQRSQREYANLWGWGRKKVVLHLPKIQADVAAWLAYEKQ